LDRVVIGRVVKAHGIRGEVVVDPLTDLPDRFTPDTVVDLGGTPRRILSSRPHQGRLLIAFEGILDRTTAEGLRGAEIAGDPVDRSDLDVYLADELLGVVVRTADGADLGVVVALVELPAAAGYDLLEVERDGARWLLPATDEYVEVDEAEDGTLTLVVVDPPAGLLPDDPDADVG
jgi:16S rRNA processing protein RimM